MYYDPCTGGEHLKHEHYMLLWLSSVKLTGNRSKHQKPELDMARWYTTDDVRVDGHVNSTNTS